MTQGGLQMGSELEEKRSELVEKHEVELVRVFTLIVFNEGLYGIYNTEGSRPRGYI